MRIVLLLSLFLFSFVDHSSTLNSHGGAKLSSNSEILPTGPLKKPKNIIFMVGDGMGLTQVSAALYSNSNHLNLEQMKTTGLIKTFSSNNLITDSAAGATAFACGCKTFNGAIGVDKDKKPCASILEMAEAQGLATGLVVTSSITHATPAAFIAHVKDRSEMDAIAVDFLKTDVDLLIGGGMKYFRNRQDGRDLYGELEQKGYFVTDFTGKKLQELAPSPKRPFVWFSANDQPESCTKGRDYLPFAGTMAPEFLDKRSDKGFFLMIEGSQIDFGGHAKNADYTIQETLDFDKTIGAVLEWAEKDGETLVVVTADHETGGMSIQYGSKLNDLDIKFNTDYHTATLVPVFAFGPGAESFGGLYDNTDIFQKMRALFAFDGGLSK